LIYRWLTFSIAIITIPILNWCTFGFVSWFYIDLAIPFTNWITFGMLSPQLLSSNWVLGVAIISSTGQFRDAHKHLGLLGFVNSWLIGLVLFWIMFNFGIETAIVVHIIYDLIVLITVSIRAESMSKEIDWFGADIN